MRYGNNDEIEEDFYDKADRLYSEMKDAFVTIDTEEDAKACIRRYPNEVDRFLPSRWKYLLEGGK